MDFKKKLEYWDSFADSGDFPKALTKNYFDLMARRAGARIPPLYTWSWWAYFATFPFALGLPWGLLVYVVSPNENYTPLRITIASLFFGLSGCSVFCTTTYWIRRKYKIPTWSDFNPDLHPTHNTVDGDQ